MKRIIVGLLCISVMGFLLGCQPKRRAYDPYKTSDSRMEGTLEHTVQYSGETLSIISQWYTGKSDNWRVIVDTNPGLRPERIRIGQVISIPRYLVIQTEPLPADFLKRFKGTASKKESKPADEGAKSSAGDIFAPTDKQAAPTPVKPAPPADSEDLFGSEKPAEKGPADVAPVVETPPIDTSAPQKEATPPKSAGSADSEREKLLDELLSQ